jgi:type IV secretory pathway VirB10-like protein
MNTFWLKIAGVVVLVAAVIVAIATFTGKGKPEKPLKTIYDQWDEDEKELTAEPQLKESSTQQQPPQKKVVKPAEPVKEPVFKELSPEEQVEAEQKWQWALNQRKMGRLPGMGYKNMVGACREIIQRWPESKYAFYAKRALADLPDRYRKMYKITDEETDLGSFK